jgi:putative ABC transport system ATP-binding protein
MKIQLDHIIPIPLADQIKKTAVWNTKLAFEPNKYYQIYSPSGKGKSTFCHTIYGLREDYEGTLSFDEEDTLDFSLEKWAGLRREKLSFLFQDLRLFTELSGLENIEVKMHLGSLYKVINAIEMAKDLDVYHCLHKPVKILSYGERQRIALIRALIQPFEVLLLDEPFSHLDPENIEKAILWIDKICKKNQATLILMGLSDESDLLKFDEVLEL